MKKRLIQATCVLAFGGISCWANAMHGYCAGSSQCVDNGTNSPTTTNPPTGFGFTVDKGGTGNLLLDILIPDNFDPHPSALSFDLTGTLTGTATLFSLTPWTSGSLDAYLGIKAQPNNPIGAYLGPCTTAKPCTDNVDPLATGFFIYQAGFPTATLDDVPHPNITPLENFAPGDPALPMGSYITGFFNAGSSKHSDWIGTANSGAIFVDAAATPPPDTEIPATVPEPASIVLLGSAALGLAAWLRRKARSQA